MLVFPIERVIEVPAHVVPGTVAVLQLDVAGFRNSKEMVFLI
jgi:hypothetical protein